MPILEERANTLGSPASNDHSVTALPGAFYRKPLPLLMSWRIRIFQRTTAFRGNDALTARFALAHRCLGRLRLTNTKKAKTFYIRCVRQ